MTYRKWGRTVRYENGTMVRVEEAGEAFEEGEEFRAQPLRDPHPPFGHLLPLTREKDDMVPLPLAGLQVERVVMTEGVALHQYGDIAWSEHARRMHLSVVRAPYRMLIDQADFDLDAALLALFAQIEGRREPPPRKRSTLPMSASRTSPALAAAPHSRTTPSMRSMP